MIDWNEIAERMNRATWEAISPRIREKRVKLMRFDWVPWALQDNNDAAETHFMEIQDQATSRGWYLDYNEGDLFNVYVCNLELNCPLLEDDDPDFKNMREYVQ